ncbi:DUF397 domain-containing protein [Streptomyces sp. DSM 44917]|uniref:DUF397 domain-containing protein n=1 Tax=Streptomyces boetiae TaxID=3075541 RepID=A0ABU2L3Q5_9ACTN|nr:DUF397 domain-containing protein [Streptomyces sp. DSM 44917]MDT0306194.1 DUF397 domain-containing protein [Streptomyces sp. DSM 44917]
MIDLSSAAWRRSTYSGNGGNCVEVSDDFVAQAGVVPVRDTKQTGAAPLLLVPARAWGAFLTAVKDSGPR